MNKHELVQGYKMVEEIKAVTGKDKVLVFQPFGRTAENMGDFIIDGSSRSFHLNDVIRICKDLRDDYAIIIMSEFPVTIEENSKVPVAVPQVPDVRVWSSVIQIADHFLGCDSLGQHMAKALGTTCTSVIGSTYPINISYPNSPDFDIIDLGEQVPLGIMREIHRWGAHAMVLTVWLHMLRVFMTGSYKPPREFNWTVGVILMTLTMFLSFTGYLLPWDQLAIWAVTVGSNMARATPFLGNEGPGAALLAIGDINLIHVGSDVRFALLGGRFVGEATLLRFYVLHCIAIPFVAMIFMAVHFWRIRKDGGISGPL